MHTDIKSVFLCLHLWLRTLNLTTLGMRQLRELEPFANKKGLNFSRPLYKYYYFAGVITIFLYSIGVWSPWR
jgi:hypothetical protein